MDPNPMSDCHSRSFCIYLYRKEKTWIPDSKCLISSDSRWYNIYRHKELSQILGAVSPDKETGYAVRHRPAY